MSASPAPAVVLAGGQAKPDLAAASGQQKRALIVIDGVSLLQRVTGALRGSPEVGDILVVGSVPDLPGIRRIDEQRDFIDNIMAGLQQNAGEPWVLIITSDLPFITPEAVTAFVHAARESAASTGANIVWAAVPVAQCTTRYPGVSRTSLRLREGALTGGNLMLARPAALLAARDRIAQAYAARKSPARLARMLGAATLARFVLAAAIPRSLSIRFLEARVSRLTGTKAGAIILDFPEIATDLDRASDFEAIRAMGPS